MRSKTSFLFLALLLTMALLVACDLVDATAVPESAASSTTAVANATPALDGTVTPGPTSSPVFGTAPAATPEVSELIVWIPRDIATRTEASTAVLQDHLRAFDAKYPTVTIKVEQKSVTGPGGILSYLRTGRSIAPSILPDLVALPTGQLEAAAGEQLIFPLDDVVDAGQFDELYPPLLTAVQRDEQTIGYPFAVATLPHLVYNTNTVTSTLPLTWERLIEVPDQRMVFAADGRDGAVLALQFYLDAGGQLTDDTGKTILDVEPLTTALEQFEAGRGTGFLASESGSLVSYDDIWLAFIADTAGIARTTPEFFLQQRAAEQSLGYTVTGGIDRPLTPLVTGWVWAASNPDPVRKALVGELITDLTTAENMGAWSLAANLLPARRDAFEQWPAGDSYVTFIGRELERGVPMPNTASTVLPLLEDAVFAVFSGATTAVDAANQTVQQLQGG